MAEVVESPEGAAGVVARGVPLGGVHVPLRVHRVVQLPPRGWHGGYGY